MARLFNVLALVFVCVTGAMHLVGVENSLYWIYPWWDILTHILGGLTMGLWAAAVASRFSMPSRRALLFIVGVGLAFGLVFEVWEVLEGVGGGWGGYWFDTVKDTVDDSIGALAAWVLYAVMKRGR